MKIPTLNKTLTLVLAVAPNQPLASPIQYSPSGKCRGNNWITYQLTVTYTKSQTVWKKEKYRICPILDDLDLSLTPIFHTHKQY